MASYLHSLCLSLYIYIFSVGIERRDRRVAASIQFQRGDAVIFKIGDKEMEGEIACLNVSPGCHLVSPFLRTRYQSLRRSNPPTACFDTPSSVSHTESRMPCDFKLTSCLTEESAIIILCITFPPQWHEVPRPSCME